MIDLDAQPVGIRLVEPFDGPESTLKALLDDLQERGLGRWAVVSGGGPSVEAAEELVLDVDHGAGDRLALRLEEPPASPAEGGRVAVVRTARVVATLFSTFAEGSKLRRRVDEAERESTTDELTGLANARAWWRALTREAARCDRHQVKAAVAVVDLDELKRTNDGEGHHAGDALLKVAATALQGAIRGHDVVARIGGDEFGVLAVDYDAVDAAPLVRRLEDHLMAAGVQASVGGAVYGPDGRINDVYRRADAAMYAAKRARREAARSTAG